MTVIAVLGAMRSRDGGPSHAMRRRVAHGVAVWAATPHATLMLTGGVTRPAYGPEAELARRLAIEGGVPEEAIRMETVSLTTRENLIEIRKVAGAANIIVVSDSWHLPRTKFIARQMRLKIETSGCGGGPAYRWPVLCARETAALIKVILRGP